MTAFDFFSLEKDRPRIVSTQKTVQQPISSCFLSSQRAVEEHEVRHRERFLNRKRSFEREQSAVPLRPTQCAGRWISRPLTFQNAMPLCYL